MYDVDIGTLNILFNALPWIFSISFISSLSIFPHASSPYSNASIRQVSCSLSLTLISSFPTWCFAPIALISLLITSHFLFNSSIWSFNFPNLLNTIPRYLQISVSWTIPSFTLSSITSSGYFPVLMMIYLVFFNPYIIFFLQLPSYFQKLCSSFWNKISRKFQEIFFQSQEFPGN